MWCAWAVSDRVSSRWASPRRAVILTSLRGLTVSKACVLGRFGDTRASHSRNFHVCLSSVIHCRGAGCVRVSGWTRAGTLYVVTDVPLMTNFTTIYTSVIHVPGPCLSRLEERSRPKLRYLGLRKCYIYPVGSYEPTGTLYVSVTWHRIVETGYRSLQYYLGSRILQIADGWQKRVTL